MIEAPTNCPSCQSVLVWVNDTLYCKNSLCPAKSAKQVEHFAKTLKIKGLGPATIDKLRLESIDEIYEVDLAYTTAMLGSVKLAVKLLDEIERSKKEPLNTVLPAFGIPLVGKSAADKLSKVVADIFEIDADMCKIAGLGPKATENLMNWMESQFYTYLYDLPFDFKFSNVTSSKSGDKGIVCISGKLKSFKTKAEATAVLEERGYTVKDSLTKDVTILINESGVESAKTVKAANSGVRIVNNIKDLIGE